GRWPWPRSTIAKVLDRLKDYNVGMIGFDIVFSEPDQNQSLTTLKRLESRGIASDEVKTFLDEELKTADTDGIMSNAIERHKDWVELGTSFDDLSEPKDRLSLFSVRELCRDMATEELPASQAIQNESLQVFAIDTTPDHLPGRLEGKLRAKLDQIAMEIKTKAGVAGEGAKVPETVINEINLKKQEFCWESWLKDYDQDPTIKELQAEYSEFKEEEEFLKQADAPFEGFVNYLFTQFKYSSVRNMKRYWINIPEYTTKSLHSGYFSADLSSDGVIRKSRLISRFSNKYVASLPLKMYMLHKNAHTRVYLEPEELFPERKRAESLAFLDSESGDELPDKIRVDGSSAIYINYAGARNTIPYLSVAALLSSEDNVTVLKRNKQMDRAEEVAIKKSEFLKGKFMLLGATATGIYDLRVTPFDENFPGPETHANVLSNLLNNDYFRTDKREPFFMPITVFMAGTVGTLAITNTTAILGLILSLTLMFGLYFVDQQFLFRQGILTTSVLPLMTLFGLYVILTFYKYLTEERKKKELKGTFEKYVSPQIVAEILKDPSNLLLGGRKQHMTVLFSDLRGFTTISEKLEPTVLSDVLNRYLTPMTRLVFKNRGTLDKYMGDAIMAFFGAPIAYAEHAKTGCDTALDMMEELARMQIQFKKEGLPEIDIGIGVNTGDMSVGNMGSDIVRSYTVMGDAVNLGSRLEAINKTYGTHIIISEFTQKEVKDLFITREVDWVKVKGKLLPVKIFELRGRGKPEGKEKELLEAFGRGTELYHERKFDEALASFQKCAQLDPHDYPTKIYLKRCEDYLKVPPAAEWDGVFEMKEK
ncbi:MAG: CHASE2 domain-containing protein, partial [Bdellovibrionales bacterium]|nr:CHASE2 domain-containing protein [Bdellovibrionales bacterium]